jgi:hypothetical protein
MSVFARLPFDIVELLIRLLDDWQGEPLVPQSVIAALKRGGQRRNVLDGYSMSMLESDDASALSALFRTLADTDTLVERAGRFRAAAVVIDVAMRPRSP